MVRFLLNTFPTWAVILGMMTICCVIGWFFYVIVNRFGEKFSIRESTPYSKESIHLAATFCAFILAFMIVLLWQAYSTLNETLLQEAKAIGRLEIFSESLPLAHDQLISGTLQAYVETLINDEWEKMRYGQPSEKASQLLTELRLAIEGIETSDPVLDNFRHEMLQDYNEIAFARYLRLEHIHSTIPTFFLVTIFVNMIGMYILLCLLKPAPSQLKSHHFFLSVTSMLVGLNLSFLLILDYPFSGEWSLDSTPLTYISF